MASFLGASADRLARLPGQTWSPADFFEATRRFCENDGLVVTVNTTGRLPKLGSATKFKYSRPLEGEYGRVGRRRGRRANVVVAIVAKGTNVIGYGIALQKDSGSEIEILDVDHYSRRSSGLSLDVVLGGASFSVGVGHAVIAALVRALRRPIFVNATTESSQYICQSLGFVARPGVSNPCLLDLPAADDGLTALQGIEAIRDLLRNPGHVVRLVGLSGVGKTRLAEALFDPAVGSNSLAPSLALYTDIAASPMPPPVGLASDLIAAHTRAILVIDNCPAAMHRQLSEVVRGTRLSALTVAYDITDDEPEGTDAFTLETSSTSVIEALVQRRYHWPGTDRAAVGEPP